MAEHPRWHKTPVFKQLKCVPCHLQLCNPELLFSPSWFLAQKEMFCPSASCSPVCFSRMLKRAMNTPGYLHPGPAGWTSALWNWVPRHGYRCLSPEPSPSHAVPEAGRGVLPRHCLPMSCTSSRLKQLCLGHSSGHSHSGLLIGTAGNRQVFRCRSVLWGIIFCVIFFDK